MITMMLFIGDGADAYNEDYDSDREDADDDAVDNEDADDEEAADDNEDADDKNLCNRVLSLCAFHHSFKNLLNLGKILLA